MSRLADIDHLQQIKEAVVEMNQYNVIINSAKAVRKALMENYDLDATEREVRQVMREDLGMRYRKLVPVSIHGNSEKNLVLRQ